MRRIFITIFTLFITGLVNGQTTIKLEEISQHIGDSVIVCGKVEDIRYFETSKNQPTLLNIGDKFPKQLLTVVIWGNVRAEFKNKPEEMQDKQVCVTGRITLYKEKPQIIIDNPGQITIQ
jgi:DNA/RNA endonuclease YhcR with UshA esterase domain